MNISTNNTTNIVMPDVAQQGRSRPQKSEGGSKPFRGAKLTVVSVLTFALAVGLLVFSQRDAHWNVLSECKNSESVRTFAQGLESNSNEGSLSDSIGSLAQGVLNSFFPGTNLGDISKQVIDGFSKLLKPKISKTAVPFVDEEERFVYFHIN